MHDQRITQEPIKKHSTYLNQQRKKWALVLTLASLICLWIGFCTPYWLQSWERIHTPFDRLGLWEFCLDGYIARQDQKMMSYYGCWWIFAPYLFGIWEYLLPPWFVAVQVMTTVAVVLKLIACVLYGFYSCHIVKNVERRATFSRVIFILHVLICVLLIVVVFLFGIRSQDRYWMPYPYLNWPSWSFGLVILADMIDLTTLPLLYLVMREDRHKIRYAEDKFLDNPEMALKDKTWRSDGVDSDNGGPAKDSLI